MGTGLGVGGGGASVGGGGASGVAGAAGDAKLLKLGLESAIERRRVIAVVLGEEENPSLINWFEVCTGSDTPGPLVGYLDKEKYMPRSIVLQQASA